MFEEIGAIQARLAEVQGQIAALSPPAKVNPSGQNAGAFSQALAQAVSDRGDGPPAPILGSNTEQSFPNPAPQTWGFIGAGGGASAEVTEINGQAIRVPPASLGPLPALPIAPHEIVPLPHLSASGTGAYGGLIDTYAAKHGLPPSLVKAVIQTESGGNPRAVSRAGAMGLMQLMPANVREAGIQDPYDPEQNIAAGTQQLAGLMAQYHGDLDLTLAGYNAGPGNVRKYGGVPPFAETQQYIRKVRAAMEK